VQPGDLLAQTGVSRFIDGYEVIEDEITEMKDYLERSAEFLKSLETKAEASFTTEEFFKEMFAEDVDICEEVGDGSSEEAYINEDEWEDIMITVTADSGAGNHVCSREDAPGYSVQPSEGSKRGTGFVGVDGVRIANEGEVELNLAGPQGKFKSTFQVAKVTRPLMSIARICDKGHRVVFEKSHASVLNAQGQEICRFARRGNLYMIDVKLKAPGPGFARRGQ